MDNKPKKPHPLIVDRIVSLYTYIALSILKKNERKCITIKIILIYQSRRYYIKNIIR